MLGVFRLIGRDDRDDQLRQQREELLCQIKAVPGSPEEPNSTYDESYSDIGQGNGTIEEIVDGLRSRDRCLKDLGVSLERRAQDAIVLEREEALESEGSREYALDRQQPRLTPYSTVRFRRDRNFVDRGILAEISQKCSDSIRSAKGIIQETRVPENAYLRSLGTPQRGTLYKMDHLPTVVNSYDPIAIPYLGGNEYDGLDFGGYPERQNWQISALLGGDLQGRTRVEAARYLQTWL
ncbi:hypothetical protein LTR66_013831 [Elasticomyces elasticus]|nr:hypothetical protein LTR66_013831 [Elasticomyces elasticus]